MPHPQKKHSSQEAFRSADKGRGTDKTQAGGQPAVGKQEAGEQLGIRKAPRGFPFWGSKKQGGQSCGDLFSICVGANWLNHYFLFSFVCRSKENTYIFFVVREAAILRESWKTAESLGPGSF